MIELNLVQRIDFSVGGAQAYRESGGRFEAPVTAILSRDFFYIAP